MPKFPKLNPNLIFIIILLAAVIFPAVKFVMATDPGEYFAFLEGYPVMKSEAGVTGVGVAAAAKLYFTVAPSNLWRAILFRASTLFNRFRPWTYVVPSVILLAIIIVFFRKFFSFNISIGKK